MNIDAYLARIDYAGQRTPTAATLAALQQAHLYAVPFENLDIGRGVALSLEPAALFAKVVTRRRGGFCYELNGLFARLLRALGYDVTLLAAGVARATSGFGPEFDHMTLLVRAPLGVAGPWLVDVGFGDSFGLPLRLEANVVQTQGGRSYRLDQAAEHWTLYERLAADAAWEPQYRFTLASHDFGEYDEMCYYHQTSPDSSFTRRRICSRATPTGRITLSDARLIITAGSERTEQALPDAATVAQVLREHFGIALGDD